MAYGVPYRFAEVYYSSGTPYYGSAYYYDLRQPCIRPRHRDRDRDGVPNRYDRDRDGDGVPNRHDARPNNPRRHQAAARSGGVLC